MGLGIIIGGGGGGNKEEKDCRFISLAKPAKNVNSIAKLSSKSTSVVLSREED